MGEGAKEREGRNREALALEIRQVTSRWFLQQAIKIIHTGAAATMGLSSPARQVALRGTHMSTVEDNNTLEQKRFGAHLDSNLDTSSRFVIQQVVCKFPAVLSKTWYRYNLHQRLIMNVSESVFIKALNNSSPFERWTGNTCVQVLYLSLVTT